MATQHIWYGGDEESGLAGPGSPSPSDSFFYDDKQGSQRGLGRPRPIMGLPGGGRYDEAYFSDSGRESEGEEEASPSLRGVADAPNWFYDRGSQLGDWGRSAQSSRLSKRRPAVAPLSIKLSFLDNGEKLVGEHMQVAGQQVLAELYKKYTRSEPEDLSELDLADEVLKHERDRTGKKNISMSVKVVRVDPKDRTSSFMGPMSQLDKFLPDSKRRFATDAISHLGTLDPINDKRDIFNLSVALARAGKDGLLEKSHLAALGDLSDRNPNIQVALKYAQYEMPHETERKYMGVGKQSGDRVGGSGDISRESSGSSSDGSTEGRRLLKVGIDENNKTEAFANELKNLDQYDADSRGTLLVDAIIHLNDLYQAKDKDRWKLKTAVVKSAAAGHMVKEHKELLETFAQGNPDLRKDLQTADYEFSQKVQRTYMGIGKGADLGRLSVNGSKDLPLSGAKGDQSRANDRDRSSKAFSVAG